MLQLSLLSLLTSLCWTIVAQLTGDILTFTVDVVVTVTVDVNDVDWHSLVLEVVITGLEDIGIVDPDR